MVGRIPRGVDGRHLATAGESRLGASPVQVPFRLFWGRSTTFAALRFTVDCPNHGDGGHETY